METQPIELPGNLIIAPSLASHGVEMYDLDSHTAIWVNHLECDVMIYFDRKIYLFIPRGKTYNDKTNVVEVLERYNNQHLEFYRVDYRSHYVNSRCECVKYPPTKREKFIDYFKASSFTIMQNFSLFLKGLDDIFI